MLWAVAILAMGCGSQGTSPSTSTVVEPSSPCGIARPETASYSHIIWVWMENHSYNQVIGSSSAPYMNSLAAKCGLATNYHNISHPSLPNYIAATSGLGGRTLERFQGDCDPSPSCSVKGTSIFAQSPSWRAYEESMQKPCDAQNSGSYAVRHNPPTYFSPSAGCEQRDLPFTRLAPDLAKNSLPAFSFITPNLCHDTHDCPISAGDDWLASEVPKIVSSSAYRAGHTVLFITYDEGEGGSTNSCATNQSDVGCHVATVIVSPSTPAGHRSGQLFNHYSLLRTSEDLLGLSHLGHAAEAASMTKPFGLGT
jgi:phosphatidylinositol-3-phosphatase